MGLVERFDRKLESTVEDAFARVFGGSIVPEEVEDLLRREADDEVRTLAGGHRLAPNEYVITLSLSDYQKVLSDRDLTSDTFAKHLTAYIGERGWQTYGDVVVRFEQSPALHTGQVRAHGVVNPDAGAQTPPQSEQALTAEPGVPAMSDNPTYRPGQDRPDRPADEYYDDRYGRPQDDPRYAAQGGYDQGYGQQGGYQQGYAPQGGYDPAYGRQAAGYAPAAITLYLEDGSNRTFQLREGSNVIGRGQDAQFRLPDTGVSRRHVEIRWDGSVAMLTDLNSTNGTTVNDLQVSSWEWELADGDRIRVGHSDISVRFQ